jgi:3-oxoacyl-[acyl-carrier-protein] synthase II
MADAGTKQVVVTGVGVVSPIGIGRGAFWSSLVEGRSGVRPLTFLHEPTVPVRIGGEVVDFDPKQVIKPRKSLKVMCRDIQLAIHAADLAVADAGLTPGTVPPERLGVLFGADMIQCDPEDLEAAFRACLVEGRFDMGKWGPNALPEIFPLWFLRCLPNMPACHVGIVHDARGPCNTIVLGEVSGLLAVAEATEVIRRGQADVMLCGATGTRLHPTTYARSFAGQISRRTDAPHAACRPFDADRDGFVNGEGAAVFVLESRQNAEARGATILARVLGHASTFEPCAPGAARSGDGVRASIRAALGEAGLTPANVGHVNAHGLGTTADDRMEASAIGETLGDVAVTAPKSFFGNLGSGTAAVEMAASVLALAENSVPVTLNYETPDPACPVNVVCGRPLVNRPPTALLLNQTPMGQAVALVLAAP